LAGVISEADPTVIETFKNFGFQIGTAYQIYDDCVDLAGTESVTGKTLGTDLRKGKFTLPVLIFLRSASDFERERCCQFALDENIGEMIELLRNGANNGALNESIAVGSDLIRKAQCAFDGMQPNRYTDALFSLGDALCDMFDQLRV
jgi:octaprenyl-diphosphate synthase